MCDPLTANVPVAQVTLLEDRGLVRRKGQVSIPPGLSRLRIEGVAPVLADKTLAAVIRAPDGGALPDGVRVRHVSVKRWRLTAEADLPTHVAKLTLQLRDKDAELLPGLRCPGIDLSTDLLFGLSTCCELHAEGGENCVKQA